MRKQMIENAAYEVGTQVRLVEQKIESALEELAELQMRMIRARETANVPTATGHQALEQVAQSLQGMVAARGNVAMAHAILKETAQHVPGLRHTVMFGDESDTPMPTQGRADLRVVA
ncbi:hypothetical protein [Sphingomicrobium clamense]|uniref:Uncharacterized protein n=1 Tax=Sphingomicrobium clamense TaxID=2851013 RepID=A0ABS6V446_9SPHN|nr:hypothetical protein [Sphingomicrobium sp. B8]MBW0144328.1 hypothetical protein [Sphingomicrobium sp. B8]